MVSWLSREAVGRRGGRRARPIPPCLTPAFVLRDLDRLQPFFQCELAGVLTDEHDVGGLFHDAPGDGDRVGDALERRHRARSMPRSVHDAGVELDKAGGVGAAAQADGGFPEDSTSRIPASTASSVEPPCCSTAKASVVGLFAEGPGRDHQRSAIGRLSGQESRAQHGTAGHAQRAGDHLSPIEFHDGLPSLVLPCGTTAAAAACSRGNGRASAALAVIVAWCRPAGRGSAGRPWVGDDRSGSRRRPGHDAWVRTELSGDVLKRRRGRE